VLLRNGGLAASYCPASPIFNPADVADSATANDTIPQSLLLEPYPQFDGGFEGLPTLNANSWVPLAAGSLPEAGQPLRQL